MPEQIILHIGLPKTATTTVQKSLFKNYNPDLICFIGVFQPRKQPQNNIYLSIMHALDCKVEKKSGQIDKAKKLLKNKIELEKKPLLLSEEGILVDSPFVQWQEKIKRLSRIVSGFDYRIIVTVRSPLDGIYSLFCELYSKLSNKCPNFTVFFEKSNAAKIYKYEVLTTELFNVFSKEKICFIPFELIKNETKYFESINSCIGLTDHDFMKSFGHENIRKKGEKGYISKPKTIGDVLRGFRTTKFIDMLTKMPVLNIVLKSIYDRIKYFDLSHKGVEIPYLSEEQKNNYNRSLNSDNKKFFEITGIDYT